MTRINNILLVTNMYPSKKYPHYGIFVKNTANVLIKAGYKVDVVGCKKQDERFLKFFEYLRFYFRIIVSCIFGNYDVIYAHYASHTGLPLLLIKRIKTTLPIVMNVHGNDLIPETQSDVKYQKIVKKIIDKSKIVICPSQYFKDEIIKRYGKKECNICIYPSGGVNTSIFRPINKEKAKKRLGLQTDSRYIGYVSRIEANKGWDVFLQAGAIFLSKHPGYRLLVIGDGSEAKEYEALVDQLKLRDKIDKFHLLSQEDIAYAFNAMDIFVFPTRRKSESLGLVGLEAMACGTIVITSNSYGPSSYMIDGKNGFTFNLDDSNQLYKVIEKAIHSKVKKSKDYQLCCKETVDKYSIEKNKKKIQFIFENI